MTETKELDRTDWSWLQDTYWYVPTASLPALQLDPDKCILNWVVDQTVWHITGYREGYFWGVSSTFIQHQGQDQTIRAAGSQPVSFSMFGSITPEGRIHLTFIRQNRASSGSATVGIGRAILHQTLEDTAVPQKPVPQPGDWSLEMQMSSGTREETAHWAYMTPVKPGDPAWESLPGVALSVPDMLSQCQPPRFEPDQQ